MSMVTSELLGLWERVVKAGKEGEAKKKITEWAAAYSDAWHSFFLERGARNYLRDQDIERISTTFQAFEDVEKYARVVPLEEIEQNDFNLNISRYVDTAEKEERIDVAEAVRQLRELEVERASAEASMNKFLKELGYGG